MLITPERALTSAEIAAVRDWVQAGGGLFLCEQSDYRGLSKPFYTNPILEALEAGITIQDDEVLDNEQYTLDDPWFPQVCLVDHEVWYPPFSPAAFEISSLIISPTEVAVGGEVSISVVVKNTGNLEGTYPVTLEISGGPVKVENVALAGGATKSVTFKVVKDTEGFYLVRVDGWVGSFNAKGGGTRAGTRKLERAICWCRPGGDNCNKGGGDRSIPEREL